MWPKLTDYPGSILSWSSKYNGVSFVSDLIAFTAQPYDESDLDILFRRRKTSWSKPEPPLHSTWLRCAWRNSLCLWCPSLRNIWHRKRWKIFLDWWTVARAEQPANWAWAIASPLRTFYNCWSQKQPFLKQCAGIFFAGICWQHYYICACEYTGFNFSHRLKALP